MKPEYIIVIGVVAIFIFIGIIIHDELAHNDDCIHHGGQTVLTANGSQCAKLELIKEQ
jgi:hypothetical protein